MFKINFVIKEHKKGATILIRNEFNKKLYNTQNFDGYYSKYSNLSYSSKYNYKSWISLLEPFMNNYSGRVRIWGLTIDYNNFDKFSDIYSMKDGKIYKLCEKFEYEGKKLFTCKNYLNNKGDGKHFTYKNGKLESIMEYKNGLVMKEFSFSLIYINTFTIKKWLDSGLYSDITISKDYDGNIEQITKNSNDLCISRIKFDNGNLWTSALKSKEKLTFRGKFEVLNGYQKKFKFKKYI